jgi:diguanylate cyclase (GGDEF)-like protein/PAS domain S-box-containing protein
MVSALFMYRMFASAFSSGFLAASAGLQDVNVRGAILVGLVIIGVLVVLLILLVRHIHNLHKYNKELERFNEQQKALFDAEDTITYLKKENMRFVFANMAFEKLSGMSEKEIKGKSGAEVLPAALNDTAMQIELEALEDMHIRFGDVEYLKRMYRITAFPVNMAGGKVGVGVYVRDITLEHSHMKLQQRILKRNEILVDVSNGSFSTKEEQIDHILLQALELTESKYGCITFYDEESGSFTETRGTFSLLNDYGDELFENPMPDFLIDILTEAVSTQRPVIQNDYQAYLEEKGKASPYNPAPTRFLCVPVCIDGKVLSVVGLTDRDDPYFGNAAYEATLLMNTAWNALSRHEAQQSLIFERNKYLETILSIGDGVMVVNEEGKIDMLNTVAERLTGWQLDHAKGKPYAQVFRLTDDSQPSTCDFIERVLESDSSQTVQNDAILTSRGGDLYFLENSAAPIRDESGTTVGAVIVFRDVTERRAQRGRIEYLSMHDSLTGLYNRRYFEEQLVRFDTPENHPLCVIMGDVNDLKLTNDIFGHSSGDLSIVHSANAIQNVCRPVDIAARWGGDEFVLLLPQTNAAQAESVCRRIHEEMALRHVAALQCSMSLGFSIKLNTDEDIWHILTNAEQKMYAEKTTNRSRLQDDTLDAFVQTLYSNSPREQEHAERTSAYCTMIGRVMGLPEEDIKKLKDAGAMHDIGKVVLDADLLRKTDVYTDFEADEVKKHSIMGYRILNSFDGTLNLAEAVLAHHERYDGCGYPKGLKATQIPLMARIINVAESYERITRDSAGRPARTAAEAMDILTDNAGTQFDPYVAEVFVRLMQERELL